MLIIVSKGSSFGEPFLTGARAFKNDDNIYNVFKYY